MRNKKRERYMVSHISLFLFFYYTVYTFLKGEELSMRKLKSDFKAIGIAFAISAGSGLLAETFHIDVALFMANVALYMAVLRK